MKSHNWLIFGLALALVFTLTIGVPSVSQAQKNGPAVSPGTAAPDNASSYYGYDGSGYDYCPVGPGYGYSDPANQNYRNNGSRTWRHGYQGAWCPWDNGYAGGYRNSRGYCW